MSRIISCIAILLMIALIFSAGCDRAEQPEKDGLPIAEEDAAASAEEEPVSEEEDIGINGEEELNDSSEDSVAEEAVEEAPEEVQYELEYDLGDMEEILRKGVFFIVGNKAPAMDIVTISEIKSALTDRNIDTGDAKLADEVDDYTTDDYIVIGSPCDNPVAAKLLAKEIAKKGDCNIFEPGTAWIKLFKTSPDNIALFVGGDRPVYTRIAGSVVGHFEDYAFVGTVIEVSGPADKPTLSLIIG